MRPPHIAQHGKSEVNDLMTAWSPVSSFSLLSFSKRLPYPYPQLLLQRFESLLNWHLFCRGLYAPNASFVKMSVTCSMSLQELPTRYLQKNTRQISFFLVTLCLCTNMVCLTWSHLWKCERMQWFGTGNLRSCTSFKLCERRNLFFGEIASRPSVIASRTGDISTAAVILFTSAAFKWAAMYSSP